MSDEPEQEIHVGPVVAVAKDLTAIVAMHARLRVQAMHDAGDPEIPGGRAMIHLAGAANPTQYVELVDYAELHHYADPSRFRLPDLAHDDIDLSAILQTLWFWSDDLRTIHRQELGKRRPTIGSEANLIRWALGWMWDNEPRFADMAADVRDTRSQLENVLLDGDRDERTRVVCPDCDAGKHLILRFGATEDEDTWKCPTCRHRFDASEVAKAWAKQMRSRGAQRWVPTVNVISVMRTQGWQERTVRGWLEGSVEVLCDTNGRRCMAWWPDVWRTHLSARYQREVNARKAADLLIRKAACVDEHGEDCWVKGRGCAALLLETTPL